MSSISDWLIEDEIENMKKAWEVGCFYVLDEVLEYCQKHDKPLPNWAVNAIRKELNNLETSKGLGRLGNRKTRDLQYYIYAIRWDTVKELRDRKEELIDQGIKPTWDAAYNNATDCLRDTIAKGSPDTMKRSYQLVERSSKDGTSWRYRFGTNRPWHQPPIVRTS